MDRFGIEFGSEKCLILCMYFTLEYWLILVEYWFTLLVKICAVSKAIYDLHHWKLKIIIIRRQHYIYYTSHVKRLMRSELEEVKEDFTKHQIHPDGAHNKLTWWLRCTSIGMSSLVNRLFSNLSIIRMQIIFDYFLKNVADYLLYIYQNCRLLFFNCKLTNCIVLIA